MNLGLIINPTAGGGSALAAGEQAQKVFEQAGFGVLDLSGSSLIEAKANARAAILKNQIDCLVVVGGDGIMHLGVNLCAGTNLPLGLIASGTGNDAARTYLDGRGGDATMRITGSGADAMAAAPNDGTYRGARGLDPARCRTRAGRLRVRPRAAGPEGLRGALAG